MSQHPVLIDDVMQGLVEDDGLDAWTGERALFQGFAQVVNGRRGIHAVVLDACGDALAGHPNHRFAGLQGINFVSQAYEDLGEPARSAADLQDAPAHGDRHDLQEIEHIVSQAEELQIARRAVVRLLKEPFIRLPGFEALVDIAPGRLEIGGIALLLVGQETPVRRHQRRRAVLREPPPSAPRPIAPPPGRNPVARRPVQERHGSFSQ